MQEREEPRGAYVLARGEYQHREEQVYPETPAVLSPLPEDATPNRLGFAKWLLSPEHPLTARVTINRFWQNVFGTGIVKTSEDFGTQGIPPGAPRTSRLACDRICCIGMGYSSHAQIDAHLSNISSERTRYSGKIGTRCR